MEAVETLGARGWRQSKLWGAWVEWARGGTLGTRAGLERGRKNIIASKARGAGLERDGSTQKKNALLWGGQLGRGGGLKGASGSTQKKNALQKAGRIRY